MGEDNPETTMRGRVGNQRDRIRLYILLNLNRMLLTSALAAGIFISFLLVGAFTPFRQFMLHMGPTRYLFQGLVGALITGVTLVVTITQLVLSQELGPIGTERERMSDSMSFRGDVEDQFGSISPPEPESFLEALIDNSRENAEEFQQTVDGNPNSDLEEDVEQFTNHLIENAEAVINKLEDRSFGEYTVVEAALDYNYSGKIYQARRIRDKYDNDLSNEERRVLIELIEILTFFGPAREYIKNLYFQWELIDLCRYIIYTAIPALVVTGTIALYLSPALVPGEILGIDNLVWIVSFGVTIGLLPFLLLSVYILRLATIAKRTLAIGPFILRESDRATDIEWE